MRAPPARLTASFTVLLLLGALAACGSRSRDLEPGTYRAVLELPGGELPFGLDAAKEESGLVFYLVNGEERVRVSDVAVADGHLVAILPGEGSTLTATIRRGRLEGDVSLARASGERQRLPFRAEAGQAWRFFEEPSTDNADVAGRWSMTFSSDDGGEPSPGVAELAQSFEHVTGTIRTPDIEIPFLAGEVKGDELFLSRFDGMSGHLLHARVDENGHLVGEHWSTAGGGRAFRAERDPDATLEPEDN